MKRRDIFKAGAGAALLPAAAIAGRSNGCIVEDGIPRKLHVRDAWCNMFGSEIILHDLRDGRHLDLVQGYDADEGMIEIAKTRPANATDHKRGTIWKGDVVLFGQDGKPLSEIQYFPYHVGWRKPQEKLIPQVEALSAQVTFTCPAVWGPQQKQYVRYSRQIWFDATIHDRNVPNQPYHVFQAWDVLDEESRKKLASRLLTMRQECLPEGSHAYRRFGEAVYFYLDPPQGFTERRLRSMLGFELEAIGEVCDTYWTREPRHYVFDDPFPNDIFGAGRNVQSCR